MKVFKIIDCCVSLFLLIASAIDLITYRSMLTVWAGLFVIGAWHIISMVVHYIVLPKHLLSRTRSIYHYAAMISILPILFLPDGSVNANITLAILPALWPVSMAFFYTSLCIYETFNLIRHENK